MRRTVPTRDSLFTIASVHVLLRGMKSCFPIYIFPYCRLILGTAAAFCLSSCATSYRPLKNGEGFTDSQVSADQFRIGFQGNGETSLERAYDLALLRAAEVTRGHGFNYFAVVDVTNTSSVQAYTARQIVHIDTPTARAPVLGSIGSTQSGKLVRLEQPSLYCEPGTTLSLRCFATKPEKTFAYEASALEQSLRRKQKVGLP